MSVQQSIVNGLTSRRGLITYSMFGSRNGSDGTGDCSGIMSQALKEAGIPIQGLPSTVTLGQQLANNGFYRVARNESWDALTGDIVLITPTCPPAPPELDMSAPHDINTISPVRASHDSFRAALVELVGMSVL